ncbi:MAG: hypothetical protein WD793_08590 [Steroidobacteraceae bacterium]
MRRYCTLFDRNYLGRGLALHQSLMRHGGSFRLHVLCLDEATQDVLARLALPGVELLSLAELEAQDPGLRAVRGGRTPPEYYFTSKPVLMARLLRDYPDTERLSYLDSDLFFFSPAAALEHELAGSAIAVAPHKLAARNAHFAQFGRFNAGWVSVGAGPESQRFLAWWRERCIECCRLVVEDARFGDQKYLDRVPGLFPGARVVQHPGVNAGPWSLDARRVALTAGGVLIEDRPLVFFHFHFLRRLLFGLYDSGLYEFGVELTRAIRRGIYEPYLSELARHERDLGESTAAGTMRRLALTLRAAARGSAVSARD